MSDDEAYAAFRAVRWKEGRPACPHAGCDESPAYELKGRRAYKCKKCERQFSATSGTVFHSRKLALRDILTAIAIFVNGVNGYAALQLSRDLACDYKTAFVLAHKLRETMGHGRPSKLKVRGDKPPPASDILTGEVEIDGASFGGHHKKQNAAKDRKDMRSTSPKLRAVITLRERRAGGRTYTFVGKHESDAVQTVLAYVDKSATVYADEGAWWNVLRTRFGDRLKRIKHKEAYSYGDGVHTNWVESFNGRMRRAEDVHRAISRNYLAAYVNEVAWREDHRRVSNGVQFSLVAQQAAKLPASERMKGYWQRRGPRPPRRRPPHLAAAPPTIA